jgi:hypothetical protein
MDGIRSKYYDVSIKQIFKFVDILALRLVKKPSAVPTCNILCLYDLNVLESASLFFFVQHLLR